jgi:hypothetical protein
MASDPFEEARREQIYALLAKLRASQERNAALAAQLAARLHEQADADVKSRRNALFNEVLMFDARQQEALSLILKQTAFGDPAPCETPPRHMPENLRDAYTLGGKVPVEDRWFDDTYPSNYPLIYTDPEIDYFLRRLDENGTYMYGGLDHVVRRAFEKHPVRGCRVVNIGSLSPWFETTLLRYGAHSCTLDYNKIITLTKRIETLTVAEADFDSMKFDCALSISSYEHDGLGAYGDPLDPDGDLKAMRALKKIVKPGGLLYLNVSVGRERIEWNRARIYGRHRLPLFLEGWTLIDSLGFQEHFWSGEHDGEPLFILRNDA